MGRPRKARSEPVGDRGSAAAPEVRTREPEETRANILAVALREFADKGLSGARIDEIAEKTNSSKRMIYYYYGSKEGLYRAVLEHAYGDIRAIEADRDLLSLPAEEALAELVRLTFDYHNDHPEFVRLVMNENIHHGEHIGHVQGIKARNETVIRTLGGIIDKGVHERVLRSGLEPIDLHMTISALCFYNVSNRDTFSRVFAYDMSSPEATARRRETVVDIVLRWCRKDPPRKRRD